MKCDEGEQMTSIHRRAALLAALAAPFAAGRAFAAD